MCSRFGDGANFLVVGAALVRVGVQEVEVCCSARSLLRRARERDREIRFSPSVWPAQLAGRALQVAQEGKFLGGGETFVPFRAMPLSCRRRRLLLLLPPASSYANYCFSGRPSGAPSAASGRDLISGRRGERAKTIQFGECGRVRRTGAHDCCGDGGVCVAGGGAPATPAGAMIRKSCDTIARRRPAFKGLRGCGGCRALHARN